jgi:thioredoxin reductase (NADPH)
MSKPFLLVVDDDADVLRALQRDLRQRFAQDWQVVAAGSGQEAIDALKGIRDRGGSLALVLTDERMPQMSGVELIENVREIFPDAKRALLTAYADTESAIRAINSARLDYYLLKPWDPPEEKLFPVLEDLLQSWEADHPAKDACATIYGARWDPRTHDLKEFLGRNGIPYEWVDAEEAEERVEGCQYEDLPLLEMPDGSVMASPTPEVAAEALGLKTQADQAFYDLVIIGGGPAGLAAAVYAASEGLSTMLVEREATGGQAGMSSKIENYLGFPAGLSGADLARRATTQARKFGVEFLVPQEATAIRAENGYRVVELKDGQRVRCHSVMIATGVSYRRLDIPGEEGLFNKGVYYGAALVEAVSCVEEQVLVVGGANSAGQAALHFAKYAGKVIMLVRSESLDVDMSQYLIDQIAQVENIEVLTRVELVEFCGTDRLEAVRIRQGEETQTMRSNSVFIFIGAEPKTDWLAESVCRDEDGFVLSGRDVAKRCKWSLKRPPMLLETSMPGVFVAGDVRTGSVKRVANSVGEGSIAVHMVHEYLKEVKA